jgi:TIR domain
MQENIFINYRRQTDSGIAGRIYDSLSRALPGASVFMDVDKLSPGDDFEVGLQKSLASCKVLLAIIGPQWGTITDQSGQRRLDKADDFVRKELSTALTNSVRVIPVLIGGAQMPEAGTLPSELKPLAKRQAVEIRHEHFSADVDALAQAIAATTPGARHSRWRTKAMAATLALAIAAVGGMFYLKSRVGEQSGVPAAAKSGGGPAWTAWLDQAAYQREFDRQLKNQWYPRMIEAQLQDGVVKYRAFYEPFPSSTFGFHARHSSNDEEFANFDAEMTKAGFTRVFQQRITVGQRPFNQGTWTKP